MAVPDQEPAMRALPPRAGRRARRRTVAAGPAAARPRRGADLATGGVQAPGARS